MIYIAIDPDVAASGWAAWNSETKKFEEIASMSFWSLINRYDAEMCMVECLAHHGAFHRGNYKFVLDAGWLNPKTNWHGGKSLGIAAYIGKCVGQNHQAGKLIQEFFDLHAIPYELTIPKKGRVKMGIREFRKLSGWDGPLTPDSVSAAMMVWGKR